MTREQELTDTLRRIYLMSHYALDGSPSNFAYVLSRIYEAAAIANRPPADTWQDAEPPDPYPEPWQDRVAHEVGVPRWGEI